MKIPKEDPEDSRKWVCSEPIGQLGVGEGQGLTPPRGDPARRLLHHCPVGLSCRSV